MKCWRCEKGPPEVTFTPTALRNKGECQGCRKKSNARYWKKYKASLDEFKAKEKKP